MPTLPAHVSLVFLKAKAFVSISEMSTKFSLLIVISATELTGKTLLFLFGMVTTGTTKTNYCGFHVGLVTDMPTTPSLTTYLQIYHHPIITLIPQDNITKAHNIPVTVPWLVYFTNMSFINSTLA